MLSPFPVELVPHSPEWALAAEREAGRLEQALGRALRAVHHIGSTAIPAILAKPILDLMPELESIERLNAAEPALRGLGYEWWGEFGIPGRRYCTLAHPVTGRRQIQLHCFAAGSPALERHIAFRDYLRLNPEKAREYEGVKRRARDLHPDNSHAYSDAKTPWITAVEAEALAFFRRSARA